MLIVCRTKAPRRELTVIGSQYHRVRRVEMPVKMGCSRRSASPWLVLPGMRSAVETESAVKKCSLKVIGEVSALASRNQVEEQAAIATVLSDIDAEIQTLGQHRTKTAALKQAMMQELLTGRTRLV